MKSTITTIIIVIGLITLCFGVQRSFVNNTVIKGDMMQLKLKSPAFEHGKSIPRKHTCDGENISPELSWSDAPDGTKSFVLICDDPDAPGGTWVHWVIFNIPATVKTLKENINITSVPGAKEGKNSFNKLKFGGPCPPQGEHRYMFKLYALDTMITVQEGATKEQVTAAMKGHILAETVLMGVYERK